MSEDGTAFQPESGSPILSRIYGRSPDLAEAEPLGPSPEALRLLDHTSEPIAMTLVADLRDSTLTLHTSTVSAPRRTEPRGLLDVMSKGFTLLVERIVGSAPRPTAQGASVSLILPSLETPEPLRGAQAGTEAATASVWQRWKRRVTGRARGRE